MKKVYIVTHGIAVKNRPNPSLTSEGKEQMEKLKTFLANKHFDYIVSGVGKRHREAFKIIIGRKQKPNLKSEFIGVPETLSSDKKIMIFPDGKKTPIKEYAKTRYLKMFKGASSLLKRIFQKRGKDALIIGGRIAAFVAGIKKAKSGILYIFNEKQRLIKMKKC